MPEPELSFLEQSMEKFRGPIFDIVEVSDWAARTSLTPGLFKKYYDYVHDLVEKWGIPKMIHSPGAGLAEYYKRRRPMPEISQLGVIARKLAEYEIKGVPEALNWYPLPTLAYRGMGVGKDWLVERETGAVLVYALENTNISPLTDPKCKNMNREALTEAIKQRTVKINFPEGATGCGRLELAPGCALAFPLCADPWLPRKPMPDESGKPATRLVQYDPTNIRHNTRMRGLDGVGTDARRYVYDDEWEIGQNATDSTT